MFRIVIAATLVLAGIGFAIAAPVAVPVLTPAATTAPAAPAAIAPSALDNHATNPVNPPDQPISKTNNLIGADSALNARTIGEQYGGLVTDQTVTVAGRDFYQYFVAFWRDKPLNERFALTILERPSARWGNQVSIEYLRKRVFETTLPPSRSYIKGISEQAVEIAYNNVVNAETQRLLFRDQDLGPDEM